MRALLLAFLPLLSACGASTTPPTTTPSTMTPPTTTKLPPTTAHPTTTSRSTTPPQPLSKDNVARALTFLEPSMGGCFAKDPNAHGTLTLNLTIVPATGDRAGHGVVSKVDFAPSSTLSSAPVRACIATVVTESDDFGAPAAGGEHVSTTLSR